MYVINYLIEYGVMEIPVEVKHEQLMHLVCRLILLSFPQSIKVEISVDNVRLLYGKVFPKDIIFRK